MSRSRDEDEGPTTTVDEHAFILHWDIETYMGPIDGGMDASDLWTTIAPTQERLDPTRAELRRRAIKGLGELLARRVMARGNTGAVVAWDDLNDTEKEQVKLVGDVHKRLFARFFGPNYAAGVRRIGVVFAGFTAGEYDRRAREVRTDGYRNGIPNGAIFTSLPELVGLLSESEGGSGFWSDLLPTVVAAIAVFGYSFYDGDPAQRTFASYDPGDMGNLERLTREQLDGVCRLFETFASRGELEDHWKSLLHVLAPRNFGPGSMAGFGDVRDYFRSAPTQPVAAPTP